MSEHTKTPWKMEGAAIIDTDGNIVMLVVDDKYKRHVVNCVNSHDVLLEALKEVNDHAKADDPDMWKRVEAAIAKATE